MFRFTNVRHYGALDGKFYVSQSNDLDLSEVTTIVDGNLQSVVKDYFDAIITRDWMRSGKSLINIKSGKVYKLPQMRYVAVGDFVVVAYPCSISWTVKYCPIDRIDEVAWADWQYIELFRPVTSMEIKGAKLVIGSSERITIVDLNTSSLTNISLPNFTPYTYDYAIKDIQFDPFNPERILARMQYGAYVIENDNIVFQSPFSSTQTPILLNGKIYAKSPYGVVCVTDGYRNVYVSRLPIADIIPCNDGIAVVMKVDEYTIAVDLVKTP